MRRQAGECDFSTLMPATGGSAAQALVSCSWSHTLVCTSSHHIMVWGTGHNNELCLGPLFTASLPTILSFPCSGPPQVYSTPYTSFILVSGTIYSCGHPSLLGRAPSESLEAIPLTDITTMAAGRTHLLALDSKNVLYSWTNETLPVPIAFPEIKIKSLAAGGEHSLAVSESGDVYSWGLGDNGRLGLGDTTSVSRPTRIATLGYSASHVVVQVAAGESHSMALTDEGMVLTWGSGSFGRLGHGDQSDQTSPKVVRELGAVHVWGVGCGQFHSFAITNVTPDRSRSSLWVWGCGQHGKLGLGDESSRQTPAPVPYFADHGLQVTAASFGTSFSVALTATGDIFSWGLADHLRCGVPVSGPLLHPTLVHYDELHRATGDHIAFELRMNKFAEQARRSKLSTRTVLKVATCSAHSLALTTEGVFAWGANSSGQLGTGVQSPYSPRPVRVQFPGSGPRVTDIACGTEHCLALTELGAVLSWGSNEVGQLGLGRETARTSAPELVRSLQGTFVVSIACGGLHSAAVGRYSEDGEDLQRGRLFLWGSDHFGQLGLGGRGAGCRSLPQSVDIASKQCTAVSLGTAHTLCVLENSDRVPLVYGCGRGSEGQLGQGTVEHSRVLVPITLPTGPAEQISAGGHSSMALVTGTVYCWGEHPQLRAGADPLLCPLAAKDLGALKNRVLRGVSCGIARNSVRGSSFVIDWGPGPLSGPHVVDGDWSKSLLQVESGDSFSLALTIDGRVFSWGDVSEGRLGQGDETLDASVLSDPQRPTVLKSLSRGKYEDDIRGLGLVAPRVVPLEEVEEADDPNAIDEEYLRELNRLHELQRRLEGVLRDTKLRLHHRLGGSGPDTPLVPAGRLTALIRALYIHPCFMDRLAESVTSDPQVFIEFTFHLFDCEISTDLAKVYILLKRVLERHIRVCVAKDKGTDLLGPESLAYRLVFVGLLNQPPIRRSLIAIATDLGARLDALDTSPSKSAAELLAGLCSPSHKKTIQQGLGPLVGFIVENLRLSLPDEFYEFVGSKVLAAVLDFLRPHLLPLHQSALDMLRDSLDKLDPAVLHDFVIDISQNSLNEEQHLQSVSEAIAADHITRPEHSLTFRTRYAELLAPFHVPVPPTQCLLEFSSTPGTPRTDSELINNCSVCGLWVPSDSMELAGATSHTELATYTSAVSTAAVPKKEHKAESIHRHELYPLDCAVLHRILKSALDKGPRVSNPAM